MTRSPDEERERLGLGIPPAWADRWGEDRYGVFASFVIGGVAQRMRWIEPGRFVMGSPEDEPGRLDHEGPQHEVTLTEGYWMADTPCTQGLWEAVMGENPSRFKSLGRPVEQVSWDEVQEFLERLNGEREGLRVSLPTEAQWEYACRAGTTTATYGGPIQILGSNNAPVLDEIAWYGGNSGVGFDLDEGEDSSGWPEKQFAHEVAGTREVGQKRPNEWGLYDMLGNVWEWCADNYGEYEAMAVENPRGAVGRGPLRVVRGGGWDGDARRVRAACRFGDTPDGRYDDLGFRLVRGQGLRQAGERSESQHDLATSRDGKQARGPSGDRPASAQRVQRAQRETPDTGERAAEIARRWTRVTALRELAAASAKVAVAIGRHGQHALKAGDRVDIDDRLWVEVIPGDEPCFVWLYHVDGSANVTGLAGGQPVSQRTRLNVETVSRYWADDVSVQEVRRGSFIVIVSDELAKNDEINPGFTRYLKFGDRELLRGRGRQLARGELPSGWSVETIDYELNPSSRPVPAGPLRLKYVHFTGGTRRGSGAHHQLVLHLRRFDRFEVDSSVAHDAQRLAIQLLGPPRDIVLISSLGPLPYPAASVADLILNSGRLRCAVLWPGTSELSEYVLENADYVMSIMDQVPEAEALALLVDFFGSLQEGESFEHAFSHALEQSRARSARLPDEVARMAVRR